MIKAKKKFGQNFLQDESIKDKIIESIPKFPRIVEIGPGLGDLTQRLVHLDSKLECFEIDSELYAILLDRFSGELESGKITLHNVDALEAWDEISVSEYFLVANLPYYVATNIILRALDDEKCKGLVVMIQREVALKFSAKAGDRDFSSLAVLAALRGECELLFDVAPSAFVPAPKVTSSVIKLVKKDNSNLNPCELDAFKGFLKTAFSAPRKTLIKNLSAATDKSSLEKIFLSKNISLSIRPHELDFALYIQIFQEVNDERRKQSK